MRLRLCLPSAEKISVPVWMIVSIWMTRYTPYEMPAHTVSIWRRGDTVDSSVAEEGFAKPRQAMKTSRYWAVGCESHQVVAGSPMATMVAQLVGVAKQPEQAGRDCEA